MSLRLKLFDMKYIDEYREKQLIISLSAKIHRSAKKDYSFMEVCGGHTAAIHRFGIPSLLPATVRLISGPGCPVCVTSTNYIDTIIAMSGLEDVIIATFGDLIRVPGSFSSLEIEKVKGADVRIVISALDALQIARSNTDRKVIFAAIGFETTAPGTAVAVCKAKDEGTDNFFILSAHKVMPPAMEAILGDGTRINGFICPGHVAAITGADAFRFIPDKYNLGCVVTGFEPVDIMQSVLMLINQVNDNAPKMENQYTRAVTPEGNMIARNYMATVFEPCTAEWRGIGTISSGGLKLRKEFESFDAAKVFSVKAERGEENNLCICGDILRGNKRPPDCPLFADICNPEKPVGACMVSSEGACNTYFKYPKNE